MSNNNTAVLTAPTETRTNENESALLVGSPGVRAYVAGLPALDVVVADGETASRIAKSLAGETETAEVKPYKFPKG